jgi:putative DNA primase/helicase
MSVQQWEPILDTEAKLRAVFGSDRDDDHRTIVPLADRAAARTQTGNADRLVELHGDNLRYVSAWDRWITWDGAVWCRDDHEVRVTELAKDVGRELLREAADIKGDKERNEHIAWGRTSLGANGIRDMIVLARGIAGVRIEHETLDADPWLLGVLNGVVDLKTGKLRDADPRDLMTMQAPVLYDRSAPALRFRQAMREWFPDEATRFYVQRVAGAALVGEQRDHIFVINYGPGGNGKGSFTRALQRALGPYAVTPHINLLVQTKHAEHDTIKAALFRARLAIASETEHRVRLAEASVKNLTGRDRISCRRLYENPWEFEPTHSLWLQTNHLPGISGRDHGIWRRIRVVPWTETFQRPTSGTDDFDAALSAEAPGILRWLVEGCLAWQQDGLAEPEAVVRATLAYRQAEDTFARFAADEHLVFEATRSIAAATLNALLDEWTTSQGLKPSRRDFADWLKENGAAQSRAYDANGKRYRAWTGIGEGSTP